MTAKRVCPIQSCCTESLGARLKGWPRERLAGPIGIDAVGQMVVEAGLDLEQGVEERSGGLHETGKGA